MSSQHRCNHSWNGLALPCNSSCPHWQATKPSPQPQQQNSFNLSSMNAAVFEIPASQPSPSQSSQASQSQRPSRSSQSFQLSGSSEIPRLPQGTQPTWQNTHWAPFQPALNAIEGPAPHVNDYVHPTRGQRGVRRNVPYEREEQARVDGRPYVFADYPEKKHFAYYRSQGL